MTVAVSMSAVWLKLITILCLFCTVLSGPGSSGVVWKHFGETITIQCRYSNKTEYLYLKRGLSEDLIFIKEYNSDKSNIVTGFGGRLQLNGVFPNLDILIKNLTSDDTGPYWCEYKRFDDNKHRAEITKGTGSVLLVVTDRAQTCEPSDKNVALVSVVICAAVLLGIIVTGLLIVIILKIKALCSKVKPRRVATSDVYEDMRGTRRR
ncbi:uncharacterized protein [Pempheris klunzingeri]|uniref:uncharacterized protein n=1 Tax=Pempheris klunzingeri TaxID=3127111 RepID=UPI0039816D8D